MGKFWVILIIIVVLIFSHNSGYLDNIISGFSVKDTNSNEQFCSNIVPERIDLRCKNSYENYYTCISYYDVTLEDHRMITKKLTWNDGVNIEMSYYYGLVGDCHTGNKEGENIDYIYCKNLVYFKTPIIDNVIQKDIKYKIDLVLDYKDHTDNGYKVIQSKCLDY